MFTRIYSFPLLTSAVLTSSLLLSQASCNGYVAGAESDEPTEACGPVLATVRVVPDRLTVLRVPDGSALAGARIEIPAGSIKHPTDVSLSLGRDLPIEADQQPLSRALCLRHDQGDFAIPAVLVLPLDKARYQKLGLTPEGVGFAAQTKTYATPASVGPGRPAIQISRAPEASVGPAPLVHGLYALDPVSGRGAIEITQQGIYQLISRGQHSPPENNELDILFTIDNSGSMGPKQAMLARLFPRFFDRVSHKYPAMTPTRFANCVNWRLGTLTTDVSYDPMVPGDDGKLQNQFCQNKKMTPEAMKLCTDVLKCDNTLPAVTKPYLDMDMSLKTDYEVQKKQFQCMMFAGDSGNGQERPLEAFSRFLQEDKKQRLSTLPTATPFFRSKSLSVALFVTDESDCSVHPSQIANFQKTTAACTTHSPECYQPNFRCYAMGLTCDKTPSGGSDFHSFGAYEKCTEASYSTMPPKTGMAGIMKPTKDFANELVNFVKGPAKEGNLERKFLESFMLRAIVPHNPARSTEIKDAMMKYTTGWQINFTHSSANSPPTDADAFCVRKEMGVADIVGHPETRMKNFIENFYLASLTKDDMKRPLVEIRSICDTENELAQSLDGLADAVRSRDTLCPMTILP